MRASGTPVLEANSESAAQGRRSSLRIAGLPHLVRTVHERQAQRVATATALIRSDITVQGCHINFRPRGPMG